MRDICVQSETNDKLFLRLFLSIPWTKSLSIDQRTAVTEFLLISKARLLTLRNDWLPTGLSVTSLDEMSDQSDN